MLSSPRCHDYNLGGFNITCVVTGAEWLQNTYIITHVISQKCIVIDPGDNAEFIIQYIRDVGGSLSHILLTHPHHDHVGAAAKLSEHYCVNCELHKNDVRLLIQAPMYALSLAKRSIPAVTRFVSFENFLLEEEGFVVRSLHTPGHTKGSVCYLFDGFVFTGDTLLNTFIGRTDLPGGNLEELRGSITKLLATLKDDTVIFPGHGKSWVAKEARAWWLNQLNALSSQHNQFMQMKP